uniref:hypothetical protein n=1 Tax=Azospirillum argentinense TaxID=2970906 RepID=UPI0010BFF819|nr:hypothetical protein [Azospirillum argentinense]
MWGDSLTYLGQVVVLNLMALGGHLTLERVFVAMTGPALAGAVVHFAILRPASAASRICRGVPPLLVHRALGARQQPVPDAAGAEPCLADGGDGRMASTAAFQAVVNLVNIANPIIIGMGNLVPQVAARGRSAMPDGGGAPHPTRRHAGDPRLRRHRRGAAAGLLQPRPADPRSGAAHRLWHGLSYGTGTAAALLSIGR